MQKNPETFFLEMLGPLAFIIATLVAILMHFIKGANESEEAIYARLKASTTVKCTETIVRGARGETYKGYIVRLLDKDVTAWTYQIKSSHPLATFCERSQKVVTGEQR